MELIKKMFEEVITQLAANHLKQAADLASVALKCLRDQIKLEKEAADKK